MRLGHGVALRLSLGPWIWDPDDARVCGSVGRPGDEEYGEGRKSWGIRRALDESRHGLGWSQVAKLSTGQGPKAGEIVRFVLQIIGSKIRRETRQDLWICQCNSRLYHEILVVADY